MTRYAIYLAPDPGGSLARAAEAWFEDDDPETRALTASARRYGFHATLKAPFRLARGRAPAELERAFERFARSAPPPPPCRLEVARLDGFFALRPIEAAPALDALAGAAVEAFEPFRAPLDPNERARRRPERLSERQRALMDRWGYPFVFEEFRFHMTLCGPAGDCGAAVERRLRERFGPALRSPVALDRIALMREPEAEAAFVVLRRERLSA